MVVYCTVAIAEDFEAPQPRVISHKFFCRVKNLSGVWAKLCTVPTPEIVSPSRDSRLAVRWLLLAGHRPAECSGVGENLHLTRLCPGRRRTSDSPSPGSSHGPARPCAARATGAPGRAAGPCHCGQPDGARRVGPTVRRTVTSESGSLPAAISDRHAATP